MTDPNFILDDPFDYVEHEVTDAVEERARGTLGFF
jgi:hypothetical protein